MVAYVFNVDSWTDNDFIADPDFGYKQTYENIYQSVYYLDSPTFDDPPR